MRYDPEQPQYRMPSPLKPAAVSHGIEYRPDIDGLRALAVLVVVGYHAGNPYLPGGFVGVDIFFVISGFLISSIIYKDLRQGQFSIIEFYIRRVRRIFPALLMVLVFTAVVGWILLLPSEFVRLGKQIVGGSAFIANFVLLKQTDYLNGSVEKVPLLHLWSLGIEEQFYLIFPIICMAFYRARTHLALPVAFFFLGVCTMAANIHFAPFDRATDFYMPYTRLWELFIGSGLSLYQHHGAGQPSSTLWRSLAGILGVALLLGAICLINKHNAFPGWWALLPCFGTALLIWAGPGSLINRYVFALPPVVDIGRISYPLYLWHWPILAFVRVAYGLEDGQTPNGIALGVIISISFVLAGLTYQFVEKPVRTLRRGPRRRLIVVGLLSGMGLVAMFGVAIIATSGFRQRVPPPIAALDHEHDLNAAWRIGSCFLDMNQTASLFSDACTDPLTGASPGPLILMWGDSHDADLYPGFKAMQTGSPLRIAQYTSSFCPPIIGFEVAERPLCRSINDAVFARVKTLKPDIVVLAALWPKMSDPLRPGATETVGQGLISVISALKSFGVSRIVIIGPAPSWTRPAPALLIDELRANPNRPLPLSLPRKLLKQYDDGPLRAIAEKSSAVYVPIVPVICDAERCQVTTGPGWNDLLTFDQDHFTVLGSSILARKIWTSVIGNQ